MHAKSKTLQTLALVVFTLIVALAVHIYVVTRKAPDKTTVSMARIDFKEALSQVDGAKITQWLYQQKGVDHVLCNAQTGITVFTFHPVAVNANDIVHHLQADLHYSAQRYLPTEEEMENGCPVVSQNFISSISNFFKTSH